MQLEKNKKYIAFVGDSYCATYEHDPPVTIDTWQGTVSGLAYPSIVARYYQYDIAPYGFGGRSWWYSWINFWKVWENRLDQIEAIVFTHTNRTRINSATSKLFPLLPDYSAPGATVDMINANKHYFKHIHDDDFNAWAQEQYFSMLKTKFNAIKTIHFHCFQGSVVKSNLLPGVIFSTPLIQISVGQQRGSADSIQKALSAAINFQHPDFKPNHFNAQNNQAMANLIIQTLNNYIPGVVEIPMQQFDQPNPNADQWSVGKYWTE